MFANRLKIGMLLQTDPTVIYGMGDAYQGRIRKRDLQTDTPWNTYTRPGLPPTPIAAAGAALLAAVQPEQHKYLFFVSKGNGTSEFSVNLNEHNRNVSRYILGQGQQAQPSRPAQPRGPPSRRSRRSRSRRNRRRSRNRATVAGPTAGATGTTRTRRMTSRGRFITLEGVDGQARAPTPAGSPISCARRAWKWSPRVSGRRHAGREARAWC